MKFDGDPIMAQGDDWIDVDTPEGLVRLTGYNEALIEVEPGETAPAVSRTNAATIRDQAAQALGVNRTYIARTSPTAAQTAAQVKALTRQNNALIRLLLNRFDGTD